MPTGGVVIDSSGGGVDDGKAVVSKTEGGFDGLVEAGGDGAARLKLGRRRSVALQRSYGNLFGWESFVFFQSGWILSRTVLHGVPWLGFLSSASRR